MLSEEEKNINNFKEKLDKDKEKVAQDINYCKQEFNNLFDTLKNKILASLDEHYKVFINKYK